MKAGDRTLPGRAREWAALLATGHAAVLSHWSAAASWGLVEHHPETVEVTVPTQRRHRRGLRVHRGRLERGEIRYRDRLPLTSPPRTVADLARQRALSDAALERVVSEALFRRLITHADLERIPRLRATPALSRHEAERKVLALLRRSGIPEPQTNVWVHGHELDFFWPDKRLALELDGFRAHGHRLAFERDRRKDLALKAHGIETLRATWRQVEGAPETVLVAVAAARAR